MQKSKPARHNGNRTGPQRPRNGRRRSPGRGPGDPGSATVRIEQVRGLLDDLLTWEHPADAVLSRWMRANRNAGARDRAEVADAAFDVLRHLRRYRHLAESGTGNLNRRLAILGLSAVLQPEALQAALSDGEQEWLSRVGSVKPESLPFALQHSVPDWLENRLSDIPNADTLMHALNQSAPLDLRINPLKVSRDEVFARLLEGEAARHQPQLTPWSPWGIRLQGRPAINRWPMFQAGEIEVQDEGSQLLAALLAPRRGEVIIDYCAGAGGKTLLLGALMRSTGRLYAFDISASRLARARPRFARSGLSNIVPVVIQENNDRRVKRLRGKAHRVLVDAPCSGLGTLRRNPDLKWRMSAQAVEELLVRQAAILDQAAPCVAPGGRLVYATCSVLPEENEQQLQQFMARHPGFRLLDARSILADRAPRLALQSEYLVLRPDEHGTDGFFAAALERTA